LLKAADFALGIHHGGELKPELNDNTTVHWVRKLTLVRSKTVSGKSDN
jgi:hypothetical protein